MPVGLHVGTEISVSASAPATFTASGYAALTFALIGEITDPGEHGPTRAITQHKPINTGVVQKLPGSMDQGDKTLQLAIDDDDAGQTLLRAAVNSGATHYFKTEYPDGAIDYFPAVVSSFKKGGGDADGVRTASCVLAITTNKAGIGLIEVAAP